MELATKSAGELKNLLRQGQTSCAEIMQSCLERIERYEPQVGAFLLVREQEQLLAEARAVDQRRRSGQPVGPLAGLPVAVKDNICTAGLPTTCASRMLANFIPPYDATVIERIRRADGIIVGKTNLDEFAMGSTTENSAMKLTRNPHCRDCVPGGSSGGSAAAVAVGETVLAVGSDTGGSIRQPASFCGVVGLKPTYGLVSRYGLIAYGSSLDQIGPLTRDVADAALLLKVMAGHDPLDSTSLKEGLPDLAEAVTAEPDLGCGPLRVGVPEQFLTDGLHETVRQVAERTMQLLQQDGQQVVPVELPHAAYAIPAYYLVACAEASSNLARYDGCQYGFRASEYEDMIDMFCRTRSDGFGPEVKRRIMLGTYALSAGYYDAYYLQAAKVRRLIARDFETAFRHCDVILHPVAPTPPYLIGEKVDDPLAMYLGDVFTVLANLAGLPAISVPCGRTDAGLPVGMQLTADRLGEPTLLAAARRLEGLVANDAGR